MANEDENNDDESTEPLDLVIDGLNDVGNDVISTGFTGCAHIFTKFVPPRYNTEGEKIEDSILIYHGIEHRQFYQILLESYEKLGKEQAEKDGEPLPEDIKSEIDNLTK